MKSNALYDTYLITYKQTTRMYMNIQIKNLNNSLKPSMVTNILKIIIWNERIQWDKVFECFMKS